MSTVEEIKRAAGALSTAEREELLAWLLDAEDEWDREMTKDAAAGKLDSWSSKRGLLFVKIHSATGRTHAFEVENDAAVLTALRAGPRAGTAVS